MQKQTIRSAQLSNPDMLMQTALCLINKRLVTFGNFFKCSIAITRIKIVFRQVMVADEGVAPGAGIG